MEQALQAIPGRKEGHYPICKRNLVNEEIITVKKKKKHGLEICWQYYRKKMT